MLLGIKQGLLRRLNAKKIKCGHNVVLNKRDVFEGNNVLADNITIKYSKLGYGTYVGHDSYISWAEIGKYCSIAPQVSTVIGRHPTRDFVSTHPAFFRVKNISNISFVEEDSYDDIKWLTNNSAIKVGNDVWIGQGARFTDGVTIGDGAIIAANSFVTKDVPAYTIVGGTPAVEIRKRFSEEEIEFLENLEWWDLPQTSIAMLAKYFKHVDGLRQYINDLGSEISVVIPNYNKGRYLHNCIKSINEQIVVPKEIIIVDDCSPDDSEKVYQELDKLYSNVVIVRQPKNGGVSKARNTGILHAKTKYVTYIDGDDYYYSKYKLLNELLLIKYYEQRENKDVLAYSRTVQVDDEGNYIKAYLDKNYYLNGSCFMQILSTWKSETIPRDFCIKKDLLVKAGLFNEGHSLYEDLELLLHIAKNTEVYYTNGEGTAYRQVGNGLSSAAREKHKQALDEIWGSFIKNLGMMDKFRFWVWKVCAKLRRMSLKK